jgi:hypothetical protein
MSIKKYIIVTADNVKELAEKVNEKIEEGYVPIGGPLLGMYAWYHQAMIKE